MSFDLSYHRDLTSLHVNCEAPRSYFIPYSDESAALEGKRLHSDRFVSLCGDWKFRFYESPEKIEDFTKVGFSTDGFDTITIPCSWQTVLGKGYDTPMYTNVVYPFTFDPPVFRIV